MKPEVKKTSVIIMNRKINVIKWLVQQKSQEVFNKAKSYRLKPLLKRALKQMPSFPHHQRTFEYYDISVYLAKYIIYNKHDFIDPRNKFICMVHNDPLGKAFNVKAFHRCQLTRLLQSNVIAV